MIVKCDYCHEEYDAQPFFYGHSISTRYNPNSMENYYIAYVRSRSICPCCGHTVEIFYEGMVTHCDIVRILTKGEE